MDSEVPVKSMAAPRSIAYDDTTISDAINTLDNALDLLVGAVATLEQRVAPVVGPDRPTAETLETDRPAMSTVQQHLWALNDRCNLTRIRLEELTSRIEL